MRLRDAVAGCTEFPGEGNAIQQKLIEFHRAMNVPILPTPQVPADERVRLRARLIVEECVEFLEAIFGLDPKRTRYDNGTHELKLESDLDEIKGELLAIIEATPVGLPVDCDLARTADALADIAYVVEGANLEFGIDSGPVLDEVHRANMAKVGGPVREDGKRLKPEGWTPPDIIGVLTEQQR